MAKIGTSEDVIDECLNHVIESRVRRIYIRDRRPMEQARAFAVLGAKLHEIVNSQPGTKKDRRVPARLRNALGRFPRARTQPGWSSIAERASVNRIAIDKADA